MFGVSSLLFNIALELHGKCAQRLMGRQVHSKMLPLLGLKLWEKDERCYLTVNTAFLISYLCKYGGNYVHFLFS